ncbi:metal ABC transporter permease [Panacibacter ginsenosidivorans]|uniref:Metal ABC transporter permease n=1 Tax=Panacibacter ginsenosidivorans TaxID=1813871 RepID=A0A5B8V8H6_9BACT|nr:metal ABC transporter permease [Panacibacter ginsenosidivorans]QEC67465.1 metal ABC transporter permease [Panacibacter ginsenosidivorans]
MFEMFQLPFMVQAFTAAVITGVLLSFLGVHVVGRGIVFVDLALGQISSLGVAFAAYIGTGLTTIPLVFTLVGALLMSFINIRDKRLKQEAIIGILYAFASAVTVLLISKTAHGDSDIQEVLFGNILSVSWEQISSIGIVFGAIGLMHLIFFRKFFTLTESFENGENHLVGIFNIWNFLFYISIGLAIVFAVKINGVIPVFSFLIIPAVSAIMLTKNKIAVIIIAFIISILAGFFGLNFSFHYDFPAGSSIVTVLGLIFIVAALYNIIKGVALKRSH